jgi:polyisoprenoid-binding protein YceI
MKTTTLLLSMCFIINFGYTKTYKVDSTQNNSITFYAEATFGSFKGVTDKIEGYVKWDMEDTLPAGELNFKIDLESIDTGIGMRNKHMRNKYLETDQYPNATFTGIITSWEKRSDSLFEAKTKGTMNIHGTENEFTASARVYIISNRLKVVTDFKINITDYNIKQPSFLFTSMNKIVRLRLVFYLKSDNNSI